MGFHIFNLSGVDKNGDQTTQPLAWWASNGCICCCRFLPRWRSGLQASLLETHRWSRLISEPQTRIEPKNHGDLIQRKINGDFMISDWIFAFSLQPGWRLTRNPMAVHGLFMKQVMAVENPWNIYLQTLGNQFVEYESVLADHSIPAHACTCTNSFGSIPSPKCWLFSRNEPAGNTHFVAIWTNLHLWFADSGLWKTNIFPIFPSPGGFPIGKIKHHLKQTQTRHPWHRKKCVLWSFLPHHPKRRRYLWTAPGAVGWFPIMVRLSEGPWLNQEPLHIS